MYPDSPPPSINLHASTRLTLQHAHTGRVRVRAHGFNTAERHNNPPEGIPRRIDSSTAHRVISGLQVEVGRRGDPASDAARHCGIQVGMCVSAKGRSEGTVVLPEAV